MEAYGWPWIETLSSNDAAGNTNSYLATVLGGVISRQSFNPWQAIHPHPLPSSFLPPYFLLTSSFILGTALYYG